LELGPRDLKNGQVMRKARTGEAAESKEAWSLEPLDELRQRVCDLLESMQRELLEIAAKKREESSRKLDGYEELKEAYGDGSLFGYVHWCGDSGCEAKIKDETGVTIRCIPWEADSEQGGCIVCDKPSSRRVLVAKAY
jgi:prolyl-tRNA synthetase